MIKIQPHKTASPNINESNKNASGGSIIIQPKLTIGQPNDKYEQEADRIADQVMRIPERSGVQRKCSACKEEEKVQKKSLIGDITPFVQRQSNGQEHKTSASLETRLNNSKGGGTCLPADTRHFMESRIGADFSNVKVHTGNDAVQMNQELGAQAFAHGNHLYFNSGKYNPSSSEGKHLLAHELVHTVQQGNNSPHQTISRKASGNTDYIGKGIIFYRNGKYQQAADTWSIPIINGDYTNEEKLINYIRRAQLKAGEPFNIHPLVKKRIKLLDQQREVESEQKRLWERNNSKLDRKYNDAIREYRLKNYDKSWELLEELDSRKNLPKWFRQKIKTIKNRILLKNGRNNLKPEAS